MRRVSGLVIALFLMVVGGIAPPAIAAAPQIRVLSNRADLISGGDALVEVRDGASVSVNATGAPGGLTIKLNGSDVTDVFGMSADGRLMGLLKNLSMGENVVTASAPGGRPARLTIVNHPIGGPVFAGPQIQPWTCFAGAVDKQCNRPPVIYATSTSRSSGGRAAAAYDPDEPAVRRRDDDDRPGQDGAVHRPPGDRRDRPRRVPHRRCSTTRASRGRRWAPQDGFNHKLVIFHGASCDTAYEQADGARRPQRDGARPRLRDDVARARQRRPQLQHRHAGRVADHDQGARDRALRRRSATRSAAAARAARSSSSRSPTPTPASTRASRRRAASPTPGRRPCSTSTTSCCAATSRTRREWAPGVVWTPDADPGRRGPPQPGERGHVHRGDPRRAANPTAQLPRRARRAGLRRGDEPEGRALHAAGLHGQRLRRAGAQDGYAAAGRSTTSASSTASRRSWRARSRPAQFVDLNAKIGVVRHRLQPDDRSAPRPTGPRSSASTAAARSTRPTTSTRSRSSTCAGPTRARSTTSTAPT